MSLKLCECGVFACPQAPASTDPAEELLETYRKEIGREEAIAIAEQAELVLEMFGAKVSSESPVALQTMHASLERTTKALRSMIERDKAVLKMALSEARARDAAVRFAQEAQEERDDARENALEEGARSLEQLARDDEEFGPAWRLVMLGAAGHLRQLGKTKP